MFMALMFCQLDIVEAYTGFITERGPTLDGVALNDVTAKPKRLLITIV